MILSDIDIRNELRSGGFKIDPAPSFPEDFDTTSVNLHLGKEFFEWDFEEVKSAFGSDGVVVDIISFNYRDLASRYCKNKKCNPDGSTILEPQRFVLATTREKVGNTDPSCCLAARVEGRSSLARLGLQIHMTAPTIHAGFYGRITLEMYNAGPFPLRLKPGVSICQLIIERVTSKPSTTMNGTQFQGQDSPKGSCE